MRTKLLTILALIMVMALLGPTGSVIAQDATASELPMCDPVTLQTLFPSEDHDDDEAIGDEKPVADEPIDEERLFDPLETSVAQPAQVDSERGTPGAPSRPAPSDTPAPKPQPKQENCRPFVYEMLSPVAGQPGVISTFGVPRPNGRKHKGADIAAPKMTPAYAVSDGTVFWILDQQGGDCCAVGVRHPDGWSSYYIHLNNDTFGTDDGFGYGLAPGIAMGSVVKAGQLLGWVGDSGNAETTVPHIHFELRTPGNEAIDAVASLAAASVPALFSAAVSNGDRAHVEPFDDDDGTALEPLLGRLASLGLLTGCGDPVGVSFCPDDPVTGGEAVTLIESFTGISVDAGALLEYPASAAGGPDAGDRCGADVYCPGLELTNDQLSILVIDALEALADSSKGQGDLESLLEPAALAVEAGSVGAELPVEVPALAPLILARCEDLSDHSSRVGTLATRGDLVLYLAEETGMVQAVPCGQLR